MRHQNSARAAGGWRTSWNWCRSSGTKRKSYRGKMMADILVVVEHHEGVFRKNTLAAISAAKTLSKLIGGEVDALVIGDGVSAVAEAASGCEVRKVLVAEGMGFGTYLAVTFAPAVADVATRFGYGAIFAPASTFGKDFMPRLSGLLDAPLASDIVGLETEGDVLRVKRPMYAGNAIGTVELAGSPLLFTVRQTAFDAAAMGGAKAPVEKVEVAAEPDSAPWITGAVPHSAERKRVEAR